MERDVPAAETDQLIPPTPPLTVYRVAIIGAACTGLAALIGAIVAGGEAAGPGPLSTVRLALVAVGLLLAGSAISLRASLPLGWFLAGITAALAWPGIPAHWDSFRLLVSVAAVVAAVAGLLLLAPIRLRLSVLTLFAAYHFFGIFLATTWPDPTPWPTQQVGTRGFLPYLMFMYLRNAYHFYSPDPGPASLIYCLVTYDTKDPATGKPEAEWIKIPNRKDHLKDPLALTYYRRLAVTEAISQNLPDYITPATFEKLDVRRRRMEVANGFLPNYPHIPLAPDEIEQPILQYRMPRPDVSRYLLPSYANHLLVSNTYPDRRAVTVKIYRLEHRIVPVGAFAQGMSPFHPMTYRAYFLGEYYKNPTTEQVELVDPQDPMLYWLVPIVPKRAPTLSKVPKREINEDEFEDYLSKHAGYKVDWRRP
jgi:hypothetical protein